MRSIPLVAVSALLFAGCTRAPKTEAKAATAAPAAAKITQFYATTPTLPRGENGLLCYGVENARSVWLSPPRTELVPALAHCEEVSPTTTTKYTLTAEGAAGPAATSEVTITVGAPRVKIQEVQFTTLNLRRGEVLGICYVVQNAQKVEIAPIGYRGGSGKSCTTDHPPRTTTYIITAIGPGGDRDKEQATVQVH